MLVGQTGRRRITIPTQVPVLDARVRRVLGSSQANARFDGHASVRCNMLERGSPLRMEVASGISIRSRTCRDGYDKFRRRGGDLLIQEHLAPRAAAANKSVPGTGHHAAGERVY